MGGKLLNAGARPIGPHSPVALRTLGIETSCDETAVAVVEADERGCRLLREALATRPHEHAELGGIVPELTVRQHLELLPKLLPEARRKSGEGKIDGVGATAGPGLAPALLVGLSFGKALAWAEKTSFHAINHLEGHLYSPFVSQGKWPHYPHVALIVSGGHTLLVEATGPDRRKILGTTRDDAAGEAFDKLARLVGLSYPGGAALEKEAAKGRSGTVSLPRPMQGAEGCDFSFSGLKNAARLLLEKNPSCGVAGKARADFCAEVQAAITECLVDRSAKALEQTGIRTFTLSGGVSANQGVLRALREMVTKRGCDFLSATGGWNTDNASMIAAVVARRILDGQPADWDADADPRWSVAC